MSALQSNAARAYPARSSKPLPSSTPSTKPRLRLVETPAQERSASVFIAVCIGLLLTAVVTVLFMNTEMANGAYKKQELNTAISNAALVTQTLQSSVDDFSTPENLAKRATELGMVQMVNPGVISLLDEKILVSPSIAGD